MKHRVIHRREVSQGSGHPVSPAMPAAIDVVVFDLGGVLIDWNPRYLYRKLFDDDAAMERFIAESARPNGTSSRMPVDSGARPSPNSPLAIPITPQ